ncbi:DNA-binding transcriptional regulator, FadR family [Sulfitobacter marinus]|uniref:DNA-binding transcriptional regulator, FadR family n=1 Tax=Sulfitobacter marinus TaxID=394264 RepID=A0A1I6RV39_9RHOB|nr:transcriptional regulator NanR [Sulfitobacter marinus]SFS68318.1 DNA-binding transcriptional regulator, FadR family [Sulfitobacter marinus]
MSKEGEQDRKIVRLKLSDQVFERLRELVASGELAPGDFVPSERTLMERFGVGRPAVREALQAMQSKGLITITHGGRSRVNALTAGVAFSQLDDIAKLLLSSEPANIEHLKVIRHILERGTARLAAAKCTSKDAADLTELIELQRAQLGDAEAFMKADIAFHTRLAEITGNPLIKAITEMMLTWLFEYHASLLLWSGREETTLSEHAVIVKCLKANDEDGTEHALEAHLSRADSKFSSANQT